MKALTLWQPYATLVAASVKTVETRSWGTSYRGLLAIHAAKKWDEDVTGAIEEARANLKKCWGLRFLTEAHQNALFAPGQTWQATLGKVLAVVDLVDCRRMDEAPDAQEALFGFYGEGRWGWVFDPATIRPLPEPVPCPGARQLWDVPSFVEAAIARQPGPAYVPRPAARMLFDAPAEKEATP